MNKFKGPVTLRDVTVEFTKAEWELLTPAQKALYKNVMLENYRHLLAVGYRVVNRSVISKLKKGKEPWVSEKELPNRRRAGMFEKIRVACDL
ncbi:hypothetical protein NN561_010787 [Cricetulus griseus]